MVNTWRTGHRRASAPSTSSELQGAAVADITDIDSHPLTDENEIRLITLHPSSQPDDIVRCDIGHYVLSDLYHTSLYHDSLLSVNNSSTFSPSQERSEWLGFSQGQQQQDLGEDWVDVGPLVDDATKHLPLFRYTWGDYLALSYTWGGLSETREIIVNGKSMRITVNLARALRVLRDKQYIKDGWKLWIDALCINQQDIKERATQVKRMRQIYSKAWSPIVWLGLSNDEDDSALELVRTLATTYDIPDAVSSITTTLRRDPKAYGDGSWRALHNLMTRHYWRRAWILQEASLGRNDMPVLCGDQTISWVDVHRAFWLINKSDEIVNIYITNEVEGSGAKLDIAIWNSMFVVGEIHKLQDEQIAKHAVNLYRVMSLSRNVFATDPRDKIYGLLAMMDESLTRNIMPDYLAPVRSVYIDFAKDTIEDTKSLELLRHTSSYGTLDLPSWTLSSTLHAASGISHPEVRYLEDGALAVKGFKLDDFDGMGCLWREEPSGDGWPARTVLQSSSTQDPYGSADNIREAIWRTVVADRDVYVEPLAENYSALLALNVIEAAKSDISEDHPLKPVAESNTLDWGSRFFEGNMNFRICGAPLRDYLPASYEEIKDQISVEKLRDALIARDRINVRRRMVTTKKGYIGMALQECQVTDVIFVLFGCSMPMVLRPAEEHGKTTYKIVGECYVHGLMEGEAMQWLDSGERIAGEIVIR